MKVNVHFVCSEIVGSMKDGIYEVPEGATIRDLFAVCEKENGIFVKEEYHPLLIFLANGKPAKWDTVLDDGHTVHVIRAAVGG